MDVNKVTISIPRLMRAGEPSPISGIRYVGLDEQLAKAVVAYNGSFPARLSCNSELTHPFRPDRIDYDKHVGYITDIDDDSVTLELSLLGIELLKRDELSHMCMDFTMYTTWLDATSMNVISIGEGVLTKRPCNISTDEMVDAWWIEHKDLRASMIRSIGDIMSATDHDGIDVAIRDALEMAINYYSDAGLLPCPVPMFKMTYMAKFWPDITFSEDEDGEYKV